MHKLSATIAVLTLSAPLARAQTPEPGAPDPAKVHVRLGPLWLNPTFALTNAGVDTNVFNEPDQLAPKRDFTMTVTPAADLWLRLGRTWLTGNIKEDLVYYNKYASERSANSRYTAGWFVPLNRLTVKVGADYLSTRDRPGFEIDARSQRTELGFNGSVEIRALSKLFFGLQGTQRKVNYDKAAVFLDSNLQFELNRTMTAGGLTVRHQLTPLTSLTLDVAREQDRFEFSPLRDSNSTQIAGGVKFDPFALIKGGASFGYRDFQPLSPGLPGYQGSTAAVDLSYVALGSTKLGLTVIRDVQYSYDINEPYYLLTGITGSIAQQIFGPVDVVGRVGVQRLDYRDRVGAALVSPGRTDYVHTYGGGIGYHLGRDIRVGFNIDHGHFIFKYKGFSFGGSLLCFFFLGRFWGGGWAVGLGLCGGCFLGFGRRFWGGVFAFGVFLLAAASLAAQEPPEATGRACHRLRRRAAGRADDHVLRPGGSVRQVRRRSRRHVHLSADRARERPAA